MQRPIQHSTGDGNRGSHRPPPSVAVPNGDGSASVMERLVSDNALIVFGRRDCWMCHVLKLLFKQLGANPTVYEVEEDEEAAVAKELGTIVGHDGAGVGGRLPAVYVGGKLFGGLERVMSTHITGELVPILKDAGALWL